MATDLFEAHVQAWLEGDYPEAVKAEVRALRQSDPAAFYDAFYKKLSFGTGGMRGIMGIGTNRMNLCTVALATQGLATYVLSQFAHPKVAIAYDVRKDSRAFAHCAADVFTANGISVFLFAQERPTPELSFAIRHLGCQAGVMITASHNPKHYNGYKVYWADGAQVTPPHDAGIVAAMEPLEDLGAVRRERNPALLHILDTAMDAAYMDCIEHQILPPKEDGTYRQQLRVLYTPLHGTGVRVLPALLAKVGFSDVHVLAAQADPDGDFPTVVYPNPEEPEAMQLAVHEACRMGADVVLGTDPDADRIGVGVRHGADILLLNGNQTAVLLFDFVLRTRKRQGQLGAHPYIVKTVVTTEMIQRIATHYGVTCYNTLTGFKWIAKLIATKEGKENYIVGGEESFGIMIGDKVRDKDAISACAMFCEMAAHYKAAGSSVLQVLEALYRQHGFYYEGLFSVSREGKSGAEAIAALMENTREHWPESVLGVPVQSVWDLQKGLYYMQGKAYPIDLPKSNVLQFQLADQTKISMRPSGTEPKIKFYASVLLDYAAFPDYASAVGAANEKIQAYMHALGFLSPEALS